MRVGALAAVAALFCTSAAGQERVLLPQDQAGRHGNAPWDLAVPAVLTREAVVALKGNVAEWRDKRRARIGPFSRENEAINRQREAAYLHALPKRAERVPPLPEGARIEEWVSGWFAYLDPSDGRAMVVSGVWRDPRSNAGEPSNASVLALHPGEFCGAREVDLAHLTYLGPSSTRRPDYVALDALLRGDRTVEPVLALADVMPVRRPEAQTFLRFYPQRAIEREKQGGASLLCRLPLIDAASCTVAAEDPAGWGFGEAALKVAPSFEFAARDGPTETLDGKVLCLTIQFRLA